jgi:hypothetical protein
VTAGPALALERGSHESAGSVLLVWLAPSLEAIPVVELLSG